MFQGDTELSNLDQAFSPDLALAAAQEESGLSDFGDTHFIEALEALIHCVQSDVGLSPAGEISFRATVQRLLVNRLRLQRDVHNHPEIMAEEVSDPIMILGMPRTGTTKLQRLISADPQMQSLPLWKLLNPAPFDDEEPGKPEGRLQFARAVEQATRANADFTTSHETSATEVDEDSYLLLMTFEYPLMFSLYPSQSYLEWVWARPREPAHRYEKLLLQYLQWQDGGRQGRRWLLKNPGAVGCMRALHDVFPNAFYVHSHRDMLEVMPSYCRLMEAATQPLRQHVDLHQHGRDSLRYWSHEMELYRRDLAELGDALDVLDVSYRDAVTHPYAVAEQIYARCGLAFAETSRRPMEAWLADNQQYKHGKADYSLQRYGFTAADIHAAFPDMPDPQSVGSAS